MRRLAPALLFLAACSSDPKPEPVDAGEETTPEDTRTEDSEDADDSTPDVEEDAGDTADADVEEDADADTDTDDAEEDVDPLLDVWPDVPRSEVNPDADPNAWSVADGVPDGEARTGRLRDGETAFTGPESRCRPGDYVMENAHLRVCIADERAPSQYTYTGGYVVDIAPADATDGEMLEAIFPGSDLRSIAAEEIDVLRDGREGDSAVLRVTGYDVTIAAIGNFIGRLPTALPLRFETEYRLAPEGTALEVVTWVRADDPDILRRRIEPGDVLLAGDHVTAWAPEFGLLEPLPNVTSPFWFGISAEWTYGVYSPDMRVTALAPGLLESDIDPTVMTSGVVGPNTEAVFQRWLTADRDTSSVMRRLVAAGVTVGEHVTAFAGPVGDAFPERRWTITSADGAAHVIWLNESGDGVADLDAGEYTAVQWGAAAGEVTFTVPSETPITLEAPETGLVRVWVEETLDDGSAPSPAQVRISGTTSVLTFVAEGAAAIPLPPGEYTFEISRGEEFSHEIQTGVLVTAGGETMVNTALTRTMDTVGWVSGDFHQHSRRSIDSTTENSRQVLRNVGAGVDFIAPTDHDSIDDFAGLVDDMGLTDRLFTFQGIEVSPFWGHLNAFPMAYDTTVDRFGAPPLSAIDGRDIDVLTTTELVAETRARGAEIIQINHPREGSAFFNSASYDPVAGPDAADPEFWVQEFDSVEVMNDAGYTCLVMQDWFSLLSRGMRVAGVGNSDTHSDSRPSGWPRNYLATGVDAPSELTNELLVQALKSLAVSVSGGIFIDFPGGPTPGDTITATDGSITLPVRLQSPEWVGASTLIAYVNGHEVERWDITGATPADIVDFEDTITLDIASDSYVVFFAYGNGRQSVVTPGSHIFGLMNPVFVDVEGDGWTAPGVSGPEDVPRPTGIPFCDPDL